jgi:sarcosine oxidase
MAERFDTIVIGLGALGSATCWELARRGRSVLGLERFGFGHSRGASHDTSRILRHSYHTASYVRLTQEAYVDWARLEEESRKELVTTVGGLDLFPPDCAISPIDYTESLDEVGIAYDVLDAYAVTSRWPQFRLPEGTLVLHQADAAIVPAARGTRVMQEQARTHGAELREHSAVTGLRDLGDHIEVDTEGGSFVADAVVVAADAWTNDVLGHLGVEIPLEVTLEQVTYFAPEQPGQFQDLPLWIWMDDPSFYGFPCYGEQTVKAAQDCGGPTVDPEDRTSDPDDGMQRLLSEHMGRMLPASGRPVRSVRCQYTLTPDRDLVVSAVPGHERVVVGLGAAQGFKFAPTIGRLLADLAVDGATTTDLTQYRFDRPALTDPAYAKHWLV